MLDDRTGRIEVTLFEEIYQRHRDLIVKDALVLVDGGCGSMSSATPGGCRPRSDRELDKVREQQARRAAARAGRRRRSSRRCSRAPRGDARAPARGGPLPGRDRVRRRRGAAARSTLGDRSGRCAPAASCSSSSRACSAAARVQAALYARQPRRQAACRRAPRGSCADGP